MATKGEAPSRGEVTLRILAATAGAYAAGWTYAAATALLLIAGGIERANAVVWATISSYAVMVTGVLVAFALRSTGRLWLLLAAWTGGFAMVALLARPH